MDAAGAKNNSVASKSHILATRWRDLVQCKEDFLHRNQDPRKSPCMTPEVAESWVRSRELGIDPDMKSIPRLKEADVDTLIAENRLLIDTVIPLAHQFKPLLELSGYMLSFHGPDGTVLYQEGDQIAISSFNSIMAEVGSYGSLETIGTTAHSLSMSLKRPVQILGPENWCRLLENNISFSAPILDEGGRVLGALVLVQVLDGDPWEGNLPNLQSRTLGWVSSLALAVQNQYKLARQNSSLRMANSILAATLGFVDEGIISIDHKGTIRNINQEAARILNLPVEEAIGTNFKPFLGKQAAASSILTSPGPVDYLEVSINNGMSERPYLLSIRPIHGEENLGAVIRLSPSDKINALANKRLGAKAALKFDDIIGDSDALNRVKNQARRFAYSPENVLITGESGTGKELFAQALHNEFRPGGPFIAINCAAMPRNLIESELFGYEGGTFTGAERNGRPGKIELANGGTLFLDEIGDMPYELQAVLLRVLEDKRVMRLGGQHYIDVDFRLVAATNQDLSRMVAEKLFRQDLYYRLSVLKLDLPPLRQRGSDILLLCRYFIEGYCRKRGREVPALSHEVKKRILEYQWPGNVRQLENAMISAVNLAPGNVIELEHLPADILGESRTAPAAVTEAAAAPALGPEIISIRDAEIAAIKNALLRAEKNIPLAADMLGIGKSTLYRKLKEYNLESFLRP